MQTIACLYRLASLLTGDRGLAFDVTVDAFSDLDGASAAELRRAVIVQALDVVRPEVVASARRFVPAQSHDPILQPPLWPLQPETNRQQVQEVLLAIDIFPRCALVLTAFEGLSLEEASVLLHSDRELVQQGRIRGLIEMTANLSRSQIEDTELEEVLCA